MVPTEDYEKFYKSKHGLARLQRAYFRYIKRRAHRKVERQNKRLGRKHNG